MSTFQQQYVQSKKRTPPPLPVHENLTSPSISSCSNQNSVNTRKMYKPIPVSINISKEKQVWSGWSLRPSKIRKFSLPQGKDRTQGTLERGRSSKGWSLKRKSNKLKADNVVQNDNQTTNAVDEKLKIDVTKSYLSSSKSHSFLPTRDVKAKAVMTEN